MFSDGSLSRLKTQLFACRWVSEKVLGTRDGGARPTWNQQKQCAWYKVVLGLPSVDLRVQHRLCPLAVPSHREERVDPWNQPLCAVMRTFCLVFCFLSFHSVFEPHVRKSVVGFVNQAAMGILGPSQMILCGGGRPPQCRGMRSLLGPHPRARR